MNLFTILFLAVLAAASGLEYWLGRRNAAHVLQHRNHVPAAFAHSITLEAHHKAADYTLAKGKLRNIEALLGLVLTLAFTLGGGLEALQQWLGGDTANASIWRGLTLFLAVFLIMQVIELPLSLYQTFKVEQQFGFNHTTYRQYASDFAMQVALAAALGGPLLAAVLWTMQHAGAAWWLLVWAIFIGFSVLMMWAFPTFIAPLFNRFVPLQDPALKARVERLLQRCGFRSSGIYVMDGSRRSGHGNAYFTGLGNAKRIVFFDTLLNTLNHDELEAVLAHELGHFKRHHLAKALVFQAIVTLLGLGVLGWLAEQSWFYHGLGVQHPTPAAALLLFSFVAPSVGVFFRPLFSYYQRRHEFEADDFAAASAQSQALITALVKLYRDNAATLTPDPLYSAFHYSHPPAGIRISKLTEKHAQQPLAVVS